MTHFKPMLAHKYDDARVDWSQKIYMQPKLDGIRCIMKPNGCYSLYLMANYIITI